MEDAIVHFLQAGRPEAAADVVEAHEQAALEQERWRKLERWVGMLGPDLADTRPRLVMIHAWLADARHDFAGVIRLCDRAESLLDQSEQPLEDDRALRGVIAAMRAEVSFYVHGRGDEALLHARRALELLPPDYHLARATASWYEGGGLHLLGRNDEAFEVFRRASFGDYGKAVHPRAMVGLCLMGFMTGDVDYADQSARLMLNEVIARELEGQRRLGSLLLGAGRLPQERSHHCRGALCGRRTVRIPHGRSEAEFLRTCLGAARPGQTG